MDISVNIEAGQRYRVITNSITYNAILYAVGEEFIGLSGITTYTGSGSAVEILQINSAGIEAYVLENEPIFPERLTVQGAGIEIIQSQNGTIFPNHLTLYSSGIEINGNRKFYQPQIIDGVN